jgi:preprotein translocase subunit SecD
MFKVLTILFSAVIISTCSSQNESTIENVDVEFRLAENQPGENLTEYKFRNFDKKFYLHQEVLCSNSDFMSARVVKWKDEYAVEVNFTDTGKIKWAETTGNNIGKNIAMLVNGELVTCPVVRAKIDKGIAIINGGFSEEKAKIIAQGIGKK